ncbi:DEAD/DEAH box helicase [Fodinisporobacter ferrooxydans]|uniref:DEAD/DEAH box helicase n=1 Tax=Fodinisporobacter ferrooxydans TaxID=2901836 RepID=A0ABY4CNT3_9BACL|nr:DEAD/DEAH box helicase [Alicyclobacillaceae bacterium MYW30-H2]
MASNFELLSPRMKKIIYDMRWQALLPVQELAIPAILHTDRHVTIVAGTASGKTEAAFLPILTMVEKTAAEQLNVLYISPLRSLINDQFTRIEALCTRTDIPVHRWHGDVGMHQKKQLLTDPAGILQITPESLEAMFVNRSHSLRRMFEHVAFVVIDEVHAFLGRDRGIHLQSLLSRLSFYTSVDPRMIALSATVGEIPRVQTWMDPIHPEQVHVIDVKQERSDVLFALDYQEMFDGAIPAGVVRDIRELTRNISAMIFCNSRAQAETLSGELNAFAWNETGAQQKEPHYLIHHSSIDRKEREYVEQTMRTSQTPRSVICTSSLELGIDMGQVDMVIQVDATWSVSSLKQRAGRSGRRKGKRRMVQMYTFDSMGLLQAVAVTELMRSGYVEPADVYPIPYDVLFHQILSLCSERNGLTTNELLHMLQSLAPFRDIPEQEILELLAFAEGNDFLERLTNGQWIVGWNGETILNSQEFYSIFKTPEAYQVIADNHPIGTVEKNGWIDVGSTLLLAGRMWRILEIDDVQMAVRVVPSNTGTPPRYSGMAIKRGHRVSQKMFEILLEDAQYPYLMPQAKNQLECLRAYFVENGIKKHHRLIQRLGENRYIFHMFAGTDIQRTFVWMVRALGEKARMNELGHVELILRRHSIMGLFAAIVDKHWTGEELLPHTFDHERLQTKYSVYLPQTYKDRMHVSSEVDITGTLAFLGEIIPHEIE